MSEITSYTRPSPVELELMLRSVALWSKVTSPVFYGMDKVPEAGPMLFVGNHTLYGVLDAPILFTELYKRHNIFLRSLGDHMHFKIPGWSRFLRRYGVVDGTRKNCAALMASGASILVFPGGGREVAKRHGEQYTLVWKERLGFARLAIQHRCPVVPFSAVGADDMYDIVVDADAMMKTPLGSLVDWLGVRRDVILPITSGFGGTPLPKPERFYFRIGDPIDTTRFEGAHEDLDACRTLRDETRDAVEEGLAFLLEERRLDPRRSWEVRFFDRAQTR